MSLPARSTISAPAASTGRGRPMPLRLVGEPPHRACAPASPGGAPAEGRGRLRRPSRSPVADPSSQMTAATSPHSSSTVPGRSGSAEAASRPAVWIASTVGSRLVPRTCQPRAASSEPSARPRQPQPTISARANYSSCSPPCANGPRPRARNAWSSRACRSTSASVISSAPRFRRSAFCASII